MIKVLIVEDEAGIRNALQSDYDWAALDCSVSCAASGIEAIEMCIQSAPDIVITDIVIPGIDGITLFKYLKYKRTDALFIIMTGHRDFEYARNSLNLGAFAFLLKPIQREEFLGVVTRAIDTLQKRGDASGVLSQEQAIVNLLSGFPVNMEFANEQFGSVLQCNSFFVALADFDSAEHRNAEDLKNLYYFCRDTLTADRALVARMDSNRLAILLPFTREQSVETIRSYLQILQRSITRAYKFTVSFGVSHQVASIKALGDAYTEAAKMLNLRFFSGANSIHCFGEIAATDAMSGEESQLDTYQMILLAESLAESVSEGSTDQVFQSMNSLTEKLASMCGSDEALFRSALLSVVVLCLKSVFKENRRQLALLLRKYECFKQIVNGGALSEIQDSLTSLIIDLGEYSTVKGNVNRAAILQRVTQHITEHYAEEISLSSVAQAVFLSPSYLSTLISSETGKSFVDTLNGYRVQKAIELMRDPALKNMTIATRVGFKEPAYFSYIFKKYTGLSPTEYRQMHPAIT